MIGVSANKADLETAEEFFELFKTPWEPARPGRKYRVVLCVGASVENLNADVFLLYSSNAEPTDHQRGSETNQVSGPVEVEWGSSRIPLYGRLALFPSTSAALLTSQGRGVDCWYRSESHVVRRIGYDLFQEIRHLLTEGQPAARAGIPTLELHIALLRHLLLESKIAFVEIPPNPDGFDFTCCLTHDVDFFGIRRHTFDLTLVGFAARASLATLVDVVRGRRPLPEALRNWTALLSLPLVFLGVARDFWHPFEDYAGVEERRRSTFFLVPFKGRPGLAPNGNSSGRRAVPYGLSDITEELNEAAAGGSELALHGIDAWRDVDAGRAELEELKSVIGPKRVGVRMHWLYFDADSQNKLEDAGFDYDSTWGYNETVGYRAGTSQVFRLPGTTLLELPLSIMDTALLNPGRMGLSQDEALAVCRPLVSNARRFGGALVINWHDRSLAPERLWGRCYRGLLQEVSVGDRAWFATAAEAIDWFRWRRSVRFAGESDSSGISVAAPVKPAALPAALVRIRHQDGTGDVAFDGNETMTLDL
jgi:hypothetical protein